MMLVDLRSDTVTKPTMSMRRAMMSAEVGDDTVDGDPTIRALEKRGAELLGKEAALFTLSGTMSNQVAVMTFTERGDEVILPASSHLLNLEVGGMAALSGVMPRAMPAPRGVYDLDALAAEFRWPAIQTRTFR